MTFCNSLYISKLFRAAYLLPQKYCKNMVWFKHRIKPGCILILVYGVLCALVYEINTTKMNDFEELLTEKGWPFTEDHDCDEINTRHTDSDESAESTDKESSEIEGINDDSCGLNRFRHDDFAEDSENKEHSRTRDKFHSLYSNYAHRKIVGGKVSQKGKWPWIVSFGTYANGPKCGGTIINNQWILTAAHCVDDVEKPCKYNVRAGTTQTIYDIDDTHVDIMVEDIFQHPKHDYDAKKNDIALLKLSKKLDFNKYINNICLPPHERSVDVGGTTFAAGWGTTKEDGSATNDLYEVNLRVIAYEGRCVANDYTMVKGTVCAGHISGGKDTCQGDSGGPLAFLKDDRWYLLGATSWGYGCAEKGRPGFYTDVGYFREWVEYIINHYS